MSIEIIMLQMVLKDFTQDGAPITIVRFTNAPFDVTYGGDTWFAGGDLLSIGNFESNYQLIYEGLEISLSGIDASYEELIKRDGFKRAPVDVFLGSVVDGDVSVTSVKYLHRGLAGRPSTILDEESGTIVVSFETISAFKDLSKSSYLYTSSQSHHNATLDTSQLAGGVDKFFEYSGDTQTLGEDETWTH